MDWLYCRDLAWDEPHWQLFLRTAGQCTDLFGRRYYRTITIYWKKYTNNLNFQFFHKRFPCCPTLNIRNEKFSQNRSVSVRSALAFSKAFSYLALRSSGTLSGAEINIIRKAHYSVKNLKTNMEGSKWAIRRCVCKCILPRTWRPCSRLSLFRRWNQWCTLSVPLCYNKYSRLCRLRRNRCNNFHKQGWNQVSKTGIIISS